MVENVIGIMQQLGAVSLFILLLRVVHEWISKSQQHDSNMRIVLQEAKSLQVQAREQSLEFLANVDQTEATEPRTILVDNHIREQNNIPVR